ncbi:MAG: C26 family cysteine hydrolase domain-containing family, partial [Gammaproteobacteria bacterium]|nr:C26 family cysteine hydrolase domain-containing family [Gammaproteobacteria bacterium]
MFGGGILSAPHKLIIGTVADYKRDEPHHFHSVGHKYIRAVVDAMDAVPVLFPALAENTPMKHWLSHVDGLMLTGAYSNVEPHHYDGSDSKVSTEIDPERDATALPLINAALETKTPVFGICRGFQEINVALG